MMIDAPKEVEIQFALMDDGQIIVMLPQGGYDVTELERLINHAKLIIAERKTNLLN